VADGSCAYGRKHSLVFLRHMGSRLHAETGFSKVYAGKVFEWKTNCMEAKETCGNECSRNYAKSLSANQNKQDAISRVSAVQDSAKSPR